MVRKVRSQRVKRKKNRGGERLAEWRLLRHTADYRNRASTSSTLSEPAPLAVPPPKTPTPPQSPLPTPAYETPVLSSSPLPMETFSYAEENPPELTGRRIVQIKHLFDEFRRLSHHDGPFDCHFGNMIFQGEITNGLKSGFKFKCEMCSLSDVIWSEDNNNHQMDVNTAAVAGIMSIGSGYSGLQELLGSMDIHCMSNTTYDRYHSMVAEGWQKTALEEMREAAVEEARLARESGEVDRDDVPLITVVADASWAKRSYKSSNYNSASGVAAILGYRTRKVLYIGVKNKYCTACARFESKGEEITSHACYRNWSDSSSSMEAAIIVEGFRQSECMYGVKYARLIADGDSSVYKQLLEERPYENLTIEKIECTNHLLRNYCNKIKDISKDTSKFTNEKGEMCSTIEMRKKIAGAGKKFRSAVTKAVEYRKNQNKPLNIQSVELKKDLLNGPSHIFGEHLHCSDRIYFCNGKKPEEENLIPILKKLGLYSKIMTAVGSLVDNTKSLLVNVNSNYAEHFNSLVAKFIGGKRVNYTQKGSYQARCAAAVVSHNTNTPHYKLHKCLYKSSPGKFAKTFEQRRKAKIVKSATKRRSATKSKRRLLITKKPTNDPHYGRHAQKPDIGEHEFQSRKVEFLSSLKKTDDEIVEIETATRLQHESTLWREERRKLLTASNFAAVCKRLPHTKCDKLVNKLLYSDEVDSASLQYGRENEAAAREELQSSGLQIRECGLFIDRELPFLAASPDGLLGDDGIVEIKCPSAAADLTPDEAIKQKKGVFSNFWKEDHTSGKKEINVKHDYYYQIQGQLHITRRNYCNFVVWTPKGIKIEKVERDDSFWSVKMVDKLTQFYMNCILPELIDPRKTRSMPIRNPHYILAAIEKKEAKLKEMENKCAKK